MSATVTNSHQTTNAACFHPSPDFCSRCHVPRASWHCWPRLEHPVRLPNRVACSICFPFASTARSTEAAVAPSVLTEHRRCRSSSPLQKRVGRLAPRLAVIPSPLSTVLSSQSSLGKGQSSVFFRRRHGCPRWRCCVTWTTATVILPSPPLPCARSGEHHRSS